jgi:hypothetical protein
MTAIRGRYGMGGPKKVPRMDYGVALLDDGLWHVTVRFVAAPGSLAEGMYAQGFLSQVEAEAHLEAGLGPDEVMTLVRKS